MIIQNPLLTGSLSYNGADLSNVTSSNANSASVSLILTAVSSSNQQLSASYISLSASYNVFSGSASTRITVDSASIQQVSASLLQVSASYIALSGSYNTFSGSASTRVTKIENNYATTGSNSFRANQSITGSLVVSSTITAQTLVVQTVTSSIVYSSGSNIFGSALGDKQTFTGSVNITGSQTVFGTLIVGGESPVYLKFNVQETSANRVAILYKGTQGADASMVTAFGTPYLSIGAQENLVNSIQTIGFGFTNGTSYIQPAEIGFQTTSVSGYTLGDLVFATRGATTNTAPTERLRIASTGAATFTGALS